jgi:hypothetical protein
MRTPSERDRRTGAAALLGVLVPALLAGSCATNPTPPDRRRTPEAAVTSGYGGYVFVELERGGAITGELIAATGDKLTILTDKNKLGTVDFSQVRELTVGVHDNHPDATAIWAALGTLSTLSHGFFLIFTAPVWIISGISATSSESHRGLFICEPHREPRASSACLADARVYSRFPQGLPPGVGEAQLLGRAPVRVAAPPPPAAAPPGDAGAPADGGLAPEVPPTNFPAPYEPGR